MSAHRKSTSGGRNAGLKKPAYLDNFLLIAFDAIIAFDSQNKITFLNPAAEQLYGWPAREALGKKPTDLFWPVRTPDTQEEVIAGSLKMARGETIQGEYEALCKDGSSLWVEYSARALFDEKGETSGYAAVYRDITSRKRAEEDIRRLNSELRAQLDEITTLINVLPTGVWIGNEDVSVITGNPAAYQMLGLEQGINASFTNAQPQLPAGLQVFVNGEAVAPEDAPMQQVARSGEPLYNLEHELLFPDGTRKAVLANIVPLFDKQKRLRKIIGAYTDLTRHKQLQNEIQFISRMPAENPNPVLRLTRKGKILYANPASASLLESWKGDEDLTIPVELQTQLAEAFASNAKREIEIEHGGKSFFFILVPVQDAGYVNLYGTDITERKAGEEQRKQLLQREQEQRARADQAMVEAGRARAKAEKELDDRKLAEAALGAWTDSPLPDEARPIWLRYTLAVVATAIAVLIRQLLDPVLGDFILLTSIFGAIAYSVWYGGLGPAVFSAITGYVAMTWFFMEPDYGKALEPRNLVGLAVFLVSSGIVISLGDAMRRAQRHAHQSARVAVERQRQAEFRLVEQQRAEEALRESERRFNLIYNNLPFAAALATPQDVVLVDINEEFERAFGYSKAEAIGKTPIELGINREAGGRQTFFEELRRRGSVRNVEIELFNRSGKKQDYLVNADLVSMEAEKYILTTLHNITERKQIERALAESARQQEALYQFVEQLHRTNSMEDIFNAGLDAILSAVRCDRASILLFDKTDVMRFAAWRGLSEEYRQATDGHSPWKRDEVNPQPVCMDDVDTADLNDSLRVAVKKEGIGSLAFIPLVANGKLIGKFMTYYNTPHEFEQDEVELSLTIARQLAFGIDRRRAEEALARERKLLERLFETMPVMVSIYDPETKTTRLNGEFERVLGWRTDDVSSASSTLEALYPDPEYRNDVLQRMAAAAGTNEWVEVQVKARDGRKVDSLWSNISIMRDQQLVTGIALGIDITERKRAEMKLRESEERYRTIVDTANEGIWYVDLNAETLYLNEPMARILGYSVDEIIGRKVPEFCFEEDMPKARARIASNYLGHYEHFDFRFRRKDGSEVLALASTSPVHDATGQIAGALGMFVDVTERRRAEEALRISEDRLRLAVSAANIGIWDIDMVQRERTWSKEGKAIYGLGPDEFLDFERQLALTHPDDRVIVYGMVTAFRDLGTLKQLNFEHRIIRPDGALRWVDVKGEAIYNEGRDLPVRLIGTIVDITEQKQTEQALRESEERFRTLANAMPSIVWTAAPDGRITYANDQWFRYTGTTPEENAKGWPELVLHPDDYERCVREWTHALETVPDQYLIEVRNRRYDGQYRWFQTRAVPARDASGKAIAWYGVTTDIHERIEAAERLTLLAELSELIRNMEDPNELLFNVSKTVGKHLQVRRCLFNEIDLENDIEIVHRDYCRGVESVAGIHKITDYSGATSAEMAAGKTVVNHDSKTDPRTAPDYERSYLAYGERAYVAVPLMRENRWVASLWLSDDMPRQWNQEDVSLLETIAERTWNAVEKLRIAEELRVENERFMRFVNSNIVGILIANGSGKVTLANDYYLGLLGVSREELMDGRVDWRKFTPPEWLPADEKALRELSQSGICEPYEKEYVRADGTRVPVYIADAMLPGPGDEIAAFVLDMTERKRAEEALRSSEALYRSIARSIPGGGVYVVDKDMRYLVAEGPVTEAFGLSRERLEGHTVSEVFSEAQRDRMITRLEQNFAGETINYETEHKGRVYWTNQAPLLGSIGQAIIVTIDITERKRAEQALRNSEERMRLAIEANRMVAWEWNPDIDRVTTSENFAEIYGLPEVSTAAEGFALIWPEDLPAHTEKVDLVTHQGGEYRSEFRITRPADGRIVWMEERASAIIDDEGRVTRLVGVVTDITDRKQAEQALRQSEERFVQFMEHLPGLAWIKDMQGRYIYANAAAEKVFGTPREKLYGMVDEEVFPQEVAAQFRGNDERVLTEAKGIQVVETLTQDDGVLHHSLVSKFPIPGPDGSTTMIGGTAIDITERKKAEDALRIRARQQEVVASLGELALRERNLQKIFDQATAMIAEALKVEHAKVLELQPNGEALFLRSGVGWKPGRVGWETIEASPESQAGYTLRSKTPVVVKDLKAERRFIGSPLLIEHGIISGMSCIIPGPDRAPWGVLGAHSAQYMSFGPDDVSFLVAVANILGDAIHRDQAEYELRAHQEELQVLNETLEQRVKEQTEEVRKLASDLTRAEQRERHRISHILHDDFQQRIYAIQMQMAFLNDGAAIVDESVRTDLADIKEQLDELLALTRHLSIDLSPPVLRNEGLTQAVGWLASQMQEQYGLRVKMQANESFVIPDEDLQVLLFNCVRELLFNVVKHAEALEASVSLQRVSTSLRIEIKDKGKGFEVTGPSRRDGNSSDDLRSSFGLPTIRHRITLLGGQMDVQSAPGAGTQITILVPVFEDSEKKGKTHGS